MSLLTTECAAMTDPEPMVTPGRTVTVKQPPKVVQSTTTRTVTTTSTSTSTTASSVSSSSGNGTTPQSFNGTGATSLGTIRVASPALLKWSCPGCG